MVSRDKIEDFWRRSSTDYDTFYFIAEIGNNHNGSMTVAKQLIDIAVEAGADCVKFQMRDMDVLYRGDVKDAEDLGVEYTKDLLDRYNLSIEQHRELKLYADEKGVDYYVLLGILTVFKIWKNLAFRHIK